MNGLLHLGHAFSLSKVTHGYDCCREAYTSTEPLRNRVQVLA